MTKNADLPVLNREAFEALQDMAGNGPAKAILEEYLLMLLVWTDTVDPFAGRSENHGLRNSRW
jgi:hypothetical protein